MNDEDQNSLQSLEEPSTNTAAPAKPVSVAVAPEPGSNPQSTPPADAVQAEPVTKPPKPPLDYRLKKLLHRVNIYLIIFVVLFVLVAGTGGYLAFRKDPPPVNPFSASTSLSDEELEQLRGTDTRVGDPRQTLSIESNTVFAGQVLVRDNLDVAGTIKVGGPLSLTGINVAGNSLFDQVQANQLTINGESSLQGAVNVTGNLNVGGGGSFGGAFSAPQINVENLQLGGNLQLSRHIDAGGPTPGRSNGASLGSGGSSSVSGTDTAGTVVFNTGGGPGAGCYITVNFAQRFNDTPHVIVAPSNANAAAIDYYVTRNTSGFSLCAANVPPAGTSFSYDYAAID